MPRIARVVIADVAHHVTQRGNGRQFLLATDAERLVYLDLLRQAVREHALGVLGYCLMLNHVHPAWTCRHGVKAGPRSLGGSSWRREKRKPSCGRSDAARTTGARRGRQSSRGRWKNAPSAPWRAGRAAVRAKPRRRPSPSVPKLRPWPRTTRESLRKKEIRCLSRISLA